MQGDLVSILMLTLDRAEVTRRVLSQNLWHARHPYELLVADNGSTDPRVIEFIAAEEPAYHRLNKTNEGVARAFNQLFVRSRGKWIAMLGNDILMPKEWLSVMLAYAQKVDNPGIVGIECTTDLPPLTERAAVAGQGTVKAHFVDSKVDKVFGAMLFSREVLQKVGGFNEGFHPYGCEDSDFNNRVTMAGFNSFYVPGLISRHVCNDAGDNTPYRRLKDESLAASAQYLGDRIKAYGTEGYYVPLPAPRAPL